MADGSSTAGDRPGGVAGADPKPVLQGPSTPDPVYQPDPDHLTVTVLNGYIRSARRTGDDIRVEVAAAPGRVHRWPLPLTGFTMTTPAVSVHLHLPGGRSRTKAVALQSWRSRNQAP